MVKTIYLLQTRLVPGLKPWATSYLSKVNLGRLPLAGCSIPLVASFDKFDGRCLPLARLLPAPRVLGATFCLGKKHACRRAGRQKPLSPKWAYFSLLSIPFPRPRIEGSEHHDPAAPVLPLKAIFRTIRSFIFLVGKTHSPYRQNNAAFSR